MIETICQACNEKYTHKRSANLKYCSMECYTTKRIKGIFSQCLVCEKKIYASQAIVKRGGGKYCSRECLFKNLKKPIKKQCKYCKKTYYCKPYNKMISKYCSKSCQSIDRRYVFTGKDNPRWKGGTKAYFHKLRNSLQYKEWRTKVFERDNYTCVFCNKRGCGDLNADHIMPFAYFPELRYSIDNGRTLCIPCHKQTPNYLKDLGKDYYQNLTLL